MASDDEKARRQRAERLRKQIEGLKKAGKPGAEEGPAERQPGESEKEYVERRMRELEKKRLKD